MHIIRLKHAFAASLAGLIVWASAASPAFAQTRTGRTSGHSAVVPLPESDGPEFAWNTPVSAGRGIQVCEPAPAAGSESLADFGAGCGRWLQWAMGFHPELTRTPRWEIGSRERRELHVARLQLLLPQAERLAAMAGVTHVGVGEIRGTPARCALTYRLYAVPGADSVGGPIVLRGTQAQILACLPGAARTLLRLLGIKAPRIPAVVGAAPAEMSAMGRYSWYDAGKERDADQLRMEALSRRIPLASLLSFVHYVSPTRAMAEADARHMIEQCPGNFLALGAVATLLPRVTPAFAAIMNRKVAAIGAPNSPVLAYWAANRAPTPADAVRGYERIVRLAPFSADAWDELALKYGARAEAIRQSQYYEALSAQQIGLIKALYRREQFAASRATQQDPDDTDAWIDLSASSLFNDDPEQAHEAFWKALELDKGYTRTYMWGLEMYQEKWRGDAETLKKVADMAAAATFPDAELFRLAGYLRDAGFPRQAATMFGRAIVQARDAVRLHPGDAPSHEALGLILYDQKQTAEARGELETAVRLDPNITVGRGALALIYESQGRTAEAIAQYRAELGVTNAPAERLALAFALIRQAGAASGAVLQEPIQLLRQVTRERPTWYQAFGALGGLLALQGQNDAALAAYRAHARLQPSNGEPHMQMGRILRLQSKFEDAVREGELAVTLTPRAYTAYKYLADTYAASGDTEGAVRTYQRALDAIHAYAPSYAPMHADYGRLLLSMGRREQGRSELETALAQDPDPELKRSIQSLLATARGKTSP